MNNNHNFPNNKNNQYGNQYYDENQNDGYSEYQQDPRYDQDRRNEYEQKYNHPTQDRRQQQPFYQPESSRYPNKGYADMPQHQPERVDSFRPNNGNIQSNSQYTPQPPVKSMQQTPQRVLRPAQSGGLPLDYYRKHYENTQSKLKEQTQNQFVSPYQQSPQPQIQPKAQPRVEQYPYKPEEYRRPMVEEPRYPTRQSEEYFRPQPVRQPQVEYPQRQPEMQPKEQPRIEQYPYRQEEYGRPMVEEPRYQARQNEEYFRPQPAREQQVEYPQRQPEMLQKAAPYKQDEYFGPQPVRQPQVEYPQRQPKMMPEMVEEPRYQARQNEEYFGPQQVRQPQVEYPQRQQKMLPEMVEEPRYQAIQNEEYFGPQPVRQPQVEYPQRQPEMQPKEQPRVEQYPYKQGEYGRTMVEEPRYQARQNEEYFRPQPVRQPQVEYPQRRLQSPSGAQPQFNKYDYKEAKKEYLTSSPVPPLSGNPHRGFPFKNVELEQPKKVEIINPEVSSRPFSTPKPELDRKDAMSYYSINNPYYNKKNLKDSLDNMSVSKRQEFEKSLGIQFLESDRMPSTKNKSTLIILALLVGFGVDRFYAGRWFLGLLKFVLTVTSLFVLGLFLFSFFQNYKIVNFPQAELVTAIVGITSAVLIVLWSTVDIILAILGKQKDKHGRNIDV